MAKKNTTKITISVFEIKHDTVEIENLHLPKVLNEALNNTASALERLMPLSSDEGNKDSDFISNFSFNQNFLFGSFIRLNAGEETIVKLSALNKMKVDINEMITAAKEDSAGSVRDSAFFCMCDNLIVLNSAHTCRKPLETYINWVLRTMADKQQQIIITPVKKTQGTIPLKEIESIKILDSFLSSNNSTLNETIKLKNSLIKLFLDDVKTKEDFHLEDIISATLVLKIHKKDLKENNSTVLDTTLRLVDSEDIVVTGKNGQVVKGSEYLLKVVRTFERTKAAYYNEKAIETEMRRILKEVKNDEVVS